MKKIPREEMKYLHLVFIDRKPIIECHKVKFREFYIKEYVKRVQ